MAFFSLKTDRFLQAQNLSLVMQQVMVVGVLAIGQTMVILTAGIDLSCGTVMALGQIVMTKLAVESGVPAIPAIVLGILTCVAFGLLNGGLVAGVRLPAFIVTLGTLNIAFALTHVLSDDLTFSGLPSELLFFGRTFTVAGADFTYGVVLMLVLYAIAWYVLAPDRVGPARLRGRRRPRGGAADRHQDGPSPAQRVHGRWPDVRDRGDAARRRAPSSAIRTPARRRRTSTRSPPSCSAERACSAVAAP